MNQFDIDLRKEWDQLPTPDLEAMLQAELSRKPPDDDTVLTLLRILEERQPQDQELTDREKAVFERYKQRVSNRRKKPAIFPRWLTVAASAALILGLMFSVVPQKAEAETFWEMLQRISGTVLEYFSGEGRKEAVEYIFLTDNPGLQQLYDAVVELGVTEPVVPMWLPEGSELEELTAKETPMSKSIMARFSFEASPIIYKIDIFDGQPAHQYYKDNSYYERYELRGTVFHITRNNELWLVVWADDSVECSITMECQENALRRILKSIYTMGE